MKDMTMRLLLTLAATVCFIASPLAYAQDSDGGAETKSSGSASTDGDPQQPAQGQDRDVKEATNALPVFCPTGKCYGSVYGNSDNSDCAAGGKGASPGQDVCGDWSGNGSSQQNNPTSNRTTK